MSEKLIVSYTSVLNYVSESQLLKVYKRLGLPTCSSPEKGRKISQSQMEFTWNIPVKFGLSRF